MIKKVINHAKNSKIILQFLCFLVVGLINTSLNYAVYLTLLKLANLYYIYSGICGFACGATAAFFMNRAWTFKSKVSVKTGLAIYLAVQLFCLIIHVSVQFVVTEIFNLQEEYSQLPSILVTMFVNFFLIRKVVFIQK